MKVGVGLLVVVCINQNGDVYCDPRADCSAMFDYN